MKKVLIWLVIVIVVAALGYVGYTQVKANPSLAQGKATPAPTLAPVKADDRVAAEGKVAPIMDTTFGFSMSGQVTEVLVKEGDAVEAGQVIAKLDAEQLEISVAEAQANLAAAEARLAQAKAGPEAEDIAVSQAAVEVAQTGVTTAEAALASARAQLAKAKSGATAEAIAIAERQIEAAKNSLWAAQAQRDAICGRVGKGAKEVDCDAAEAGVNRSEEEVRIAQLQLEQLKASVRPEDVAVAQAGVKQAEGALATAQAQVKQAEANLARVKMSPAAEAIAGAEAGVEQAKPLVAKAQAALKDTELRAPFAGVIVGLDVKPGQYVAAAAPVCKLADLSAWQIETTDLSELNVIYVEVGKPVTITLDALPDVKIPGKVTRIEELGAESRGEIVYKVIVAPDEQHPAMRWNMTAEVTIEK